MQKKVKFKFCGGCNSLYDRKKIYNILQQKINIEKKDDESIEKEILIILNGCQRGCISSEEFMEKFDIIINTQEYLVISNEKGLSTMLHWIEGKL